MLWFQDTTTTDTITEHALLIFYYNNNNIDEVSCQYIDQHLTNMRQVQPETFPKNSNLPVYNLSSLKITPPKTPNSGQFSHPLPNIVSFLFEKNTC
jgi:hypothetical protein